MAQSNGSPTPTLNKYAYITVITRASYLPGVVLLAHSLSKTDTPYPLIVLHTPSLHANAVEALRRESSISNIILIPTTPLELPDSAKQNLIAARFADTWTKLRVFFEPELQKYTRLCHLDSDALVFSKMDAIFSTQLPPGPITGTRGLAAAHVCACNPDKDPWSPPDWNAANCAYTPLTHPEALDTATPITEQSPKPHRLLNSGVFLFEPSPALSNHLYTFFTEHSEKLAQYKFPDQDFLTQVFKDCWVPLSWKYNALKTMRYFHTNIWRDEEVVFLHYIVDKPWSARVVGGTAGYLGRDAVTHGWWWDEFEKWKAQRLGWEPEQKETVVAVEEWCAKDGEESSAQHKDLRDIGVDVQALGRKAPV